MKWAHATACAHDRARPGADAPARDPTRALLRPDVRRGHRPGGLGAPPRPGRGPRRRGPSRLPADLLRDLVGVDELHLVRLGVRHRRCRLPPDRPPATGRGAGGGGRRAPGAQRARVRGRHPGLRHDAARTGHPVAAGGRLSSGRAPLHPALRRRPRRRPSRLGGPPRPPGRGRHRRLRRSRGGRARHPVLGRVGRPHPLASRPHRRTLRPLHAHRAGRVGAVGHRRRADGAGLHEHLRGTGAGRGRRDPHRLLHVVDVLRHARGAGGRPGPEQLHRDSARALHLGVRALRSSSPARRRPVPAWRSPSTRPRTTRSSPTRRPASPSPCRSPSSCWRCGSCTTPRRPPAR